jgi:uncharacterized OB-fold protein
MARPLPLTNPDYQVFYEYIDRHQLHLQRCTSCGRVRFPLSPVCYACFSPAWEWRLSAGRGRVSSWVVFRRQYFEEFPVPYVVVQVEMEEGPRLTANLLSCEPEAVRMGMPVEVVYEDLPGGRSLLQFAPRGRED